jgi:hypothetical protein
VSKGSMTLHGLRWSMGPDKLQGNGCGCSGWAWGESHLERGAVRTSEGIYHHPTCYCPGGAVGCRLGHAFQPCPKHGKR